MSNLGTLFQAENVLKRRNALLVATAGVAVLAGMAGLYVWSVGSMRGGSLPFPYLNLAAVLAATALVTIVRGRLRAAAILALTIVLVSLTALTDNLWHAVPQDMAVLAEAPLGGRTQWHVGVSILLLGAALWQMTRARGSPRRIFFIGMVGALLLALPIAGLIVYALAFDSPAGLWRGHSLLAVLIYFALGKSALAFAWYETTVAQKQRTLWPSMLVLIGILGATLVLWEALRTYIDTHMDRVVAAQMAAVKNEIEARMQSRVLGLERMVRRWEHYGRPRQAEWEYDVGLYLNHFDGYSSIAWIDAAGRQRWRAAPLEIGPQSPAPAIPSIAAALAAARHNRGVALTPFVARADAGYGLSAIAPIANVESGEQFDGFLVASFDAQALLSDVLHEGIADGYAIEIAQGTQAVFKRNGAAVDERWTRTASLDLYSVVWHLKVAPTVATLAGLRSPLPNVVLLAGLAIALLSVWVLYFAQKANQRRRAMQIANAQLTSEMSERRVTQEKLSNEQVFVGAMLDNLTDGIVACDRHGAISVFNAAAREFHRAREASISIEDWPRTYHVYEVDAHTLLAPTATPLYRAFHGASVLGQEFAIVPPQGPARFVRASAQAIVDAAGTKLGAVMVMHDVTDAKKARDALARNITYLELLHDIAAAANRATSIEVAGETAIRRVCETTGWSVGHLYVCVAVDSTYTFQSTAVWTIGDTPALAALRRGTDEHDHHGDFGLPSLALKQGAVQWVADLNSTPQLPRIDLALVAGLRFALAQPVLIEDRAVAVLEFFGKACEQPDLGVLEVMAQIGSELGRVVERQRAHAAISESELRLRCITESAKDAIVSANSEGMVISANHAAALMFGFERDEFIGRPFSAIVAPRFRESYRRRLQRLRGESGAVSLGQTIEMVGVRKDQSEFPVEISLASWSAGEQAFYSGILRDISERRRAEFAIKALNEDLEKRVAERTAQLRSTNLELANEINERGRAENAVRQYAKQQAALARLGQQVLRDLEVEVLLKQAVGLMSAALAVEFGEALELQPGGRELLLRASSGWGERQVGYLRIDCRENLQMCAAVRLKEPIVSEDARADTRFKPLPLLQEAGAASGICVVIPSDDQPYGVLGAHCREPRQFSDEDIHFLETVASILGSAIARRSVEQERTRLFMHERAARAEAESAHQEATAAHEHAAGILESITDAFFALDDNWRFTYINRMAEPLLARERSEMIGRSFWHEFPDAVDTRFHAEFARVKEDRVTVEFEDRFPGSDSWYEVRAYPGKEGVSVYFRDITERKTSQQALRESELRLRLFVEGVRDYAIMMLDAKGLIASWNGGAERITGYRPEEVVGESVGRFYLPEDVDAGKPERAIEQARLHGSFEDEGWRVRKDGTRYWANVIVSRIDDDAGQLIGFSKIQRDLNERKRAEETLAAEKERLAVTLHSIGDGVITTDLRGTVVLMNKVAEELTGWPQAEGLGQPLTAVFRALQVQTRVAHETPAAKILRGERAEDSDALLIARDGQERLIGASAAPMRDSAGALIGAVLVFRDIAAKTRLEQEMLKSKNLESIGLLAGGIAHDFNNILTAILGNVALAKFNSKPGEAVYESLSEAEKAFGRARDLTQQLLTFSKGGAPIKTTASIAELLRDTATFVLRGSNVRAEFHIAPNLWPVRFDPGQISQVINNLTINAKQAMPSGGRISICAENVVVKEPIKAGDAHPFAPGRYVHIVIEDEGPGIPTGHITRVFDPYFTTKDTGSGLGLATSYSIVKKHEGHIAVDPRATRGARFCIHLPASTDVSDKKPPATDVTWNGKGRILIMDDEETILRVGAALMRRLGYEVELARDGETVLQLYEQALQQGRRFDVVIMDLTVPGAMGGRECIVKLHALDPQVRAIVSSGYSNDPVMADFRRYGFAGVIVKPYQLKDLSQVLHETIGTDAPVSDRAG